jgi:hypothetical protein
VAARTNVRSRAVKSSRMSRQSSTEWCDSTNHGWYVANSTAESGGSACGWGIRRTRTQRPRKEERIRRPLYDVIVASAEVLSSLLDEQGAVEFLGRQSGRGSARGRECSSSVVARQSVPEKRHRRAQLDTLEASAQRCYRVVHLDFLSRPHHSARSGCNTDGAPPRLRPR